jgi:alpha-mannosidase
MKGAEDGNGIVVRMYESQRFRGPVTLKAGFEIKEAHRINLLEEEQSSLHPEGRQVSFFIKPFEIVTLRLVPG